MTHTAVMAFQAPGFDFACISIENLDSLVVVRTVHSGEVLAAMGKLHFFAGFKGDFFVIFYLVVM